MWKIFYEVFYRIDGENCIEINLKDFNEVNEVTTVKNDEIFSESAALFVK